MDASPTLADRIRYWVTQGYVVRTETDHSAQLVRPKRFSPTEFLAMPIYLIEYLGQKDRTVYLSQDATGTITETGSGLEVSAYRRAQARPAAQRWLLVVGGFVAVIVVSLALLALTR